MAALITSSAGMTTPNEPTRAVSTLPPMPLRVAATLCLVIGLLSLVAAIAVSVPLARSPDGSWLPLALNVLPAVLVLIAAGFIWRRRKLGVLLLVLGWAVPTGFALLGGGVPRGPSILLVVVLLTLASNWKLLE